MRRLVLTVSYYLGIATLLRHVHRNHLTILLYHGVSPQKDSGLYNYRGKFISPEHFEAQIDYFRKHYSILPLDEAVKKLYAGTLPKNAMVITFDDGYRNFYSHAFPVLKRFSLPATMFVASDFVFRGKPLWVDRLEYAMSSKNGPKNTLMAEDARLRDQLKNISDGERKIRLRSLEEENRSVFEDFNDDRDVYAPLSVDEMRECSRHKITFGAHTKSHPILSHVTMDELSSEIAGSFQELKQKGLSASDIFAYPNGQPADWNKNVLEVVAKAGFTAALTTIEGANSKNTPRLLMRRMVMDATSDDKSFAAIAAGMRLFLRSLI